MRQTIKIKRIREAHHISRAQFCRDFGIPLRTAQDWDTGKSQPPEWAGALVIDAMLRKYENKEAAE